MPHKDFWLDDIEKSLHSFQEIEDLINAGYPTNLQEPKSVDQSQFTTHQFS